MALPEELNKLLEAGVHFGHQAKRWNPKMKQFIFGRRKGIYIIDLEKTLEMLKAAVDFLSRTVLDNKVVIFVGTKKQAKAVIKEAAISTGMPYVNERWVGGLLTNFATIKKRIDRYNDMLKQRDEGRFEHYIKKEVVMFNRELNRMSKTLEGLKDLKGLPAALFVVDPRREILAVREARKLNIPIVALIDTDGNPDIIDYPVPGNDDAIKSIRAVLSFIVEGITSVKQKKVIAQDISAEPAGKLGQQEDSAGKEEAEEINRE